MRRPPAVAIDTDTPYARVSASSVRVASADPCPTTRPRDSTVAESKVIDPRGELIDHDIGNEIGCGSVVLADRGAR